MDDGDEKHQQQQEKNAKPKKQVLDVKNTAKKFLMDQTFGATANTVAFISGMGALKGMNGSEIVEALRQVCVAIYIYIYIIYMSGFPIVRGMSYVSSHF